MFIRLIFLTYWSSAVVAYLLGSGGSAAMCHGYSVFVCYHALAVFVVFSLDCTVFMLSGVMRSPNVVSSLFGCFRV